MSKAKVLVIFYSTYGTNDAMAETAAKAARDAGAEVRLRRVEETAPREAIESQEDWKAQLEEMEDIATVSEDDMRWANAYLFSAPTRYGVVASQMRVFIDSLGPLWMKGELADKVATAMTSAQNPHGGQETTLMGLYTTLMHWGTIIVPPGYTDQAVFDAGGNPYGTSVAANKGDLSEVETAAIVHQAKRLVAYADKLAA